MIYASMANRDNTDQRRTKRKKKKLIDQRVAEQLIWNSNLDNRKEIYGLLEESGYTQEKLRKLTTPSALELLSSVNERLEAVEAGNARPFTEEEMAELSKLKKVLKGRLKERGISLN